jgi:hypothetical protein
MKIKNAIISLLVIMILTICMFNSVAAAPVSKQTTDDHRSYAMDAPIRTQTALVFALNNNTTVANTSVYIYGALAAKEHGAIHYIGNATITIQELSTNGTIWGTVGTVQTSTTNNEVGASITPNFAGSITPKISGYCIIRATYDGDSNYEPAVSDVIVLRVN